MFVPFISMLISFFIIVSLTFADSKTEALGTKAASPVAVQIPCVCSFPGCTCCASLNILEQNIRELGCAALSYDGEQIGVRLQVQLGGRTIYDNELSAKNPPPACVSAPQVPFIQFCARVYNIKFAPDSATACLKLEFHVFDAEVIVLDFQCLQLANGGLMMVQSGMK